MRGRGSARFSASVTMRAAVPQRTLAWKWISAGALAAAVAIGGWALSGKLTSKNRRQSSEKGPTCRWSSCRFATLRPIYP